MDVYLQCGFFELTQMHKLVTAGTCCHSYFSLTLESAPQVIPKGKWSRMIFERLILFSTPTPGEGTAAILTLFFLSLTEWLNTPPPPPPSPLITAGASLNGTSSPWRLRRWHSYTHIHTQSQTWKWDWLSLESGCTVWLDEKLPLWREDRCTDWAVTWRELFSTLSSLSVEMDGSLSFFILSNVNLSFG